VTRRLLVGVIGHVDHGKTSLVRALTGMETDRLAEEKQRGISITLGFAHFRLGDDEIDLIDMPGHERFVRTMVSGATGVDAVLLVIAANEGIQPQTEEHVDVAALLGLGQAALAITKCDLVTPAGAAAAVSAGRRLLARAGLRLAGEPVCVSVVTGEGLDALHLALGVALASEDRRRGPPGPAYLPVDRAFTMAGHGVVVTGSLRRGPLQVGQEVEILPGGKQARIRALQVHGAVAATAEPGQRVAVNLRSVTLDDLPRGAALSLPGSLPPSDWLCVSLRAVQTAPPLTTTQRFRLLVGTEEVEARLRLLDRDQLQPGETALAQLHCARPMSLPSREHFILRQTDPARTVAGGRILDPESRRLRRRDAGLLRDLAALNAVEGPETLSEALRQAGLRGITMARLARLAAMEPGVALAALPEAGGMAIAGGGMALSQTAWDAGLLLLSERLRKLLAGPAKPLSARQIAQHMPEMGDAVLAAALAQAVFAGRLRRQGGLFALADLGREEAARSRDRLLAARLLDAARSGGLTPPDLLTETDPQSRHILAALVRAGALIRTHDPGQKRDILFHPDAVREVQRQLSLSLPEEGMLVRDIGTLLGISRKFSIPLLEHLDSLQFTRRMGDRRVLGAKARL
jgi:selenocysteine-specific elongation factor